jgi:hypothetical protein
VLRTWLPVAGVPQAGRALNADNIGGAGLTLDGDEARACGVWAVLYIGTEFCDRDM